MKFKDIVPSFDEFIDKIWIPIKNIFQFDSGFSFINIKKLYFIISKYYNDSTIIDNENVFLEKIHYRLSHILPSLWYHQILITNQTLAQELMDNTMWGEIKIENNLQKKERKLLKNNDNKNVTGLTNTSDQVTQKWDLLPDLTQNKGDFIIEKNFNLSQILDKISEEHTSHLDNKTLKTNLIENFTKNINKIIVNNHSFIIKSLESLFVRWISI